MDLEFLCLQIELAFSDDLVKLVFQMRLDIVNDLVSKSTSFGLQIGLKDLVHLLSEVFNIVLFLKFS